MKGAKLSAAALFGGLLMTGMAWLAPSPSRASESALATAAAHAAAKGDPVLEALLAELVRSQAQLKLDQVLTRWSSGYRLLRWPLGGPHFVLPKFVWAA